MDLNLKERQLATSIGALDSVPPFSLYINNDMVERGTGFEAIPMEIKTERQTTRWNKIVMGLDTLEDYPNLRVCNVEHYTYAIGFKDEEEICEFRLRYL